MEYVIKKLIDEKTIQGEIDKVAEKINSDYAGKELHIVCILKGGVFFMCELTKRLSVPCTFDFMQISSYGDGTIGSDLVVKKDLDKSIEKKHVLIIEDIVDTGNTLDELISILAKQNPASLEIAALLDKPQRRNVSVTVKYSCLSVPNKFVVGCGLDYAEKHRNLPYVGYVEFKEH